jgi:hypothetical protein
MSIRNDRISSVSTSNYSSFRSVISTIVCSSPTIRIIISIIIAAIKRTVIWWAIKTIVKIIITVKSVIPIIIESPIIESPIIGTIIMIPVISRPPTIAVWIIIIITSKPVVIEELMISIRTKNSTRIYAYCNIVRISPRRVLII